MAPVKLSQFQSLIIFKEETGSKKRGQVLPFAIVKKEEKWGHGDKRGQVLHFALD